MQRTTSMKRTINLQNYYFYRKNKFMIHGTMIL